MEPLNAETPENAVRRAIVARWNDLLQVVRRQSHGGVEAEEVLQIAVTRALERANQLRDPARAEAWVGRVVRNALSDELRKRRARSLPVDEMELAAIGDDLGSCGCVLAQAEQLKPDHAKLLRRVTVDGVPVKQVAFELGLTPNNAMVRLHRARAALKQRLRIHCGTTNVRSCAECPCEERGCCSVSESARLSYGSS